MIGIITGLFLLPDGIHILSHIVQLDEVLKQVMTIHKGGFVIILIGFIHLLGGAFIVLGLLSRIMIILQIPAILAGMYDIQLPDSFLGNCEILAFGILSFLIFLFVKNSGNLSMEYYRKNRLDIGNGIKLYAFQ